MGEAPTQTEEDLGTPHTVHKLLSLWEKSDEEKGLKEKKWTSLDHS
jgi:hypothetical protein